MDTIRLGYAGKGGIAYNSPTIFPLPPATCILKLRPVRYPTPTHRIFVPIAQYRVLLSSRSHSPDGTSPTPAFLGARTGLSSKPPLPLPHNVAATAPHVPDSEDAAGVVLKVAKATETPDHCQDGLAVIRPAVVPMIAQRHGELHTDDVAVRPLDASLQRTSQTILDIAAFVATRAVTSSLENSMVESVVAPVFVCSELNAGGLIPTVSSATAHLRQEYFISKSGDGESSGTTVVQRCYAKPDYTMITR